MPLFSYIIHSVTFPFWICFTQMHVFVLPVKHSEMFAWAARETFDCPHYLLWSIIGFHDPSHLQNSISRNRNKDTRKTLILPCIVSWETTEGELCSSSQGSSYSSSGTAVSCSCVSFLCYPLCCSHSLLVNNSDVLDSSYKLSCILCSHLQAISL